MIANVFALNKFHVVDFRWRLNPLESVSVAKLHSFWHHFEAKVDQGILGKLRIVTRTKESKFLDQLFILGLLLVLCLIILIKYRSVQVCLIVAFLGREDTVLSGGPLQICTGPLMHIAMALANAVEPRID